MGEIAPRTIPYQEWLKHNSEKWRDCPDCDGSGMDECTCCGEFSDCRTCDGEGLVIDKIDSRDKRRNELIAWDKWCETNPTA